MISRIILLLCVTACIQLSSGFMKVQEFLENSKLLRCYDQSVQASRQISDRNINGQALPLPNSLETFISLIEKYESLNSKNDPRDTVLRLLQSFRIDDLDPDLEDKALREGSGGDLQNDIKRAILSSNQPYRYGFNEDDFSDDEKCALHIMLSHTVNDTRIDGDAVENKPKIAKQPLEVGVVSLNSQLNHAFALGRVLMGILASYISIGSSGEGIKTNTILKDMKKDTNPILDTVSVNPVFAVTMGDLVTRLTTKSLDDDIKILPNGIWEDIVCPLNYKLEDNNGAYVTLSELRGGIDGLIIGKRLQDNKEQHNNMKLSQILRMYYGLSGLLDQERTRWCSRERVLQSFTELEDQMVNFNKFFKVANGGFPGEENKVKDQISRALTAIRNNAFKDINDPECSVSEMNQERRYTSPTNIFVIMDYNQAKLDFQREVIGYLSTSLDVRPRGNLMGVFTNIKPMQQNMLDTIVKNTGTAGCPSCFAKYYRRPASREDEAEILRDLNRTLETFEVENDALELQYGDQKAGSPGKVILYFNYGSPNTEYRVQDALWDFRRYFSGATILGVGENKDTLKQFTENEDLDIFLGTTSAEKTAKEIKERLKTVPAEFQFKECASSGRESENRQEAYISPNKIQYWAMYPQYFLKSYGIKLKFKPQDGTSITVCFTRWFPEFVEKRATNCKTSNGEEIDFWASNPCHKKNVFNCEPFFFSVEAKKPPIENCRSLRCSTPRDIQFEFSHEGISCNIANFITVSNLALLLAVVMLYLQRH